MLRLGPQACWFSLWCETEAATGALSKLRKTSIRFIKSVRPSIRVQRFSFHKTEFYELLYFGLPLKPVGKKSKFFKIGKISGTLWKY